MDAVSSIGRRYDDRTVFVDHSSQPGGGQLSLMRYLRQAPDAVLIVFRDGPLAEASRAAGVETIVLRAKTRPGRLLELARKLRGRDVVVVNSLKAAYYVSLTPMVGLRPIYYLREDLSRGWLHGPRRWLALGWSLPRFHGFISNSRWTESTLTPRLARLPHAVAYPISGVEVTSHDRDDPTALRVLSLSRLNEWKGVHVLIAALGLLARDQTVPPIEVTIAGDDVFNRSSYVGRLKAEAAATGAAIRFIGHVDDVLGLLASHDVLVSCSLSPEPFGQVIAQSLANGLVTVATDRGGPSEVITHEVDGLLLPPGDERALAAALGRLARKPDLRRRLSEAGMSTAETYVDSATGPALGAVVATIAEAIRLGKRSRRGLRARIGR